mgnify:CR=1 FL=1
MHAEKQIHILEQEKEKIINEYNQKIKDYKEKLGKEKQSPFKSPFSTNFHIKPQEFKFI